ncbi:hypothetical protein QN277_022190 [Acacia crassicarpa]|uniref:Uncharacterized protein n=1 Tax=Acacia crassicarpa TaxID=499986 RepID=A0AAE1MPA8_9FABA|nr:hypothetical protein QN277_022190 [Acacia crassicarpa]
MIQTPFKSDEESASIFHTPLSVSNYTIAYEYANPAHVYPIPGYTVSHMEDSMMTQTTSESTMEESEEFDFRSFLRSSPSRDDESDAR